MTALTLVRCDHGMVADWCACRRAGAWDAHPPVGAVGRFDGLAELDSLGLGCWPPDPAEQNTGLARYCVYKQVRQGESLRGAATQPDPDDDQEGEADG